MTRQLSREEAKLITRRRLLAGAETVLRQEGLAELTTSRVAREAGVAQPTFYVHFKGMDELLQALADEKIGQIRPPLRAARRSMQSATGVEALRETFRLPLRALIEHPELCRLFAQEHHRPGSPIGRVSRELRAELQRELVEDLAALGAPTATPAGRERLEMIAESLIVLTETMALGHIDGRYPDLERMVDVLVGLAYGVAPPTVLPPT